MLLINFTTIDIVFGNNIGGVHENSFVLFRTTNEH